jgi:hypothetical protein
LVNAVDTAIQLCIPSKAPLASVFQFPLDLIPEIRQTAAKHRFVSFVVPDPNGLDGYLVISNDKINPFICGIVEGLKRERVNGSKRELVYGAIVVLMLIAGMALIQVP